MADEMEYQLVGRDALRSGDASRSPTTEGDNHATSAFRALLDQRFGTIEDVDLSDAGAIEVVANGGDEEEEIGFRLFASQSAPTKVDLRSPSPPTGDPGFMQSERPSGHYFAEAPSALEEEKLAISALSGEDVLALSRSRWAGCALPWRIYTAIAGTGLDKSIRPGEHRKRRRSSKKARIALRVKEKAKLEKEEEAKRAAEEKERYLREKKSAENRKKQLKKRAKEKAKKSEVNGSAQAPSLPPD